MVEKCDQRVYSELRTKEYGLVRIDVGVGGKIGRLACSLLWFKLLISL